MPSDADVQGTVSLRKAQDALEDGRWAEARNAFEAVLAQEELPDAMSGLGNALWWLGETEASVRHQERAYAGFRRRGDDEQAALTAIYLSLVYNASLGNDAASRGWLARAARVADEARLDELQGWVSLCRASVANDAGGRREAETQSRIARDAAVRLGDRDLELCALSELGTALMGLGSFEEGASLLDEAMAAALAGEATSLDTVVLASCRTVTSCSRAADVRRATQWVRAADQFNRRYGSPHLYTTCRTAYGGVLFATGRWADAERELSAALEIGAAAERAVHAEALAKLAELRLAQGRAAEAQRLLTGFENHPVTALVRAAIHLARGEAGPASAILRRRLREVGEDCLDGAMLTELLIEAELLQDLGDAAADKARQISELGARLGCEPIVARGERALGRCLLARDEAEDAVPRLETALSAFGRLEMPLEATRSQLLLAMALAAIERDAAIAEARGSLSGFEQLGAGADADAAAGFLRSLGVRASRAGPKGIGLLTRREREVLSLLSEGLSNREIGERLFITRKTVEHHVASLLAKLELRGRAEAAAYAVRYPITDTP